MAQIGYFGRPFETKKLREIQGDEKDYLRFVLGQKPNLMIPALEEGLATMAEGARAEGIMAATSTMGTAARTTIPIIICTGRTTT